MPFRKGANLSPGQKAYLRRRVYRETTTELIAFHMLESPSELICRICQNNRAGDEAINDCIMAIGSNDCALTRRRV